MLQSVLSDFSDRLFASFNATVGTLFCDKISFINQFNSDITLLPAIKDLQTAFAEELVTVLIQIIVNHLTSQGMAADKVDKTVISDALDGETEPELSVVKIKAWVEGVNTTIVHNLPRNLKKKVPPNAPVLQGRF